MMMTEKYKILAKFIKDISSETPDVQSYLFVKENISKYKLSAAWLIENCGFKKIKDKNVGVYKNQALVITNLGNATGKEIYSFSQKIKSTVLEKFDILLEEEVNII